MPLILCEKDLEPLYREPSAMDGLLKGIEEALTAHNRDQVRGQVRVETGLTDPKRKFRIMTAAGAWAYRWATERQAGTSFSLA